MEDFNALITRRRSTRKFTDELIAPEEVQQLLKAALMAPTSKNSHSWQFITVEDKDMLTQLARCKSAGGGVLEGWGVAGGVVGGRGLGGGTPPPRFSVALRLRLFTRASRCAYP